MNDRSDTCHKLTARKGGNVMRISPVLFAFLFTSFTSECYAGDTLLPSLLPETIPNESLASNLPHFDLNAPVTIGSATITPFFAYHDTDSFQSTWNNFRSGAKVNLPLIGAWQFSASAITTFHVSLRGHAVDEGRAGALVRNIGDSNYLIQVGPGQSGALLFGLGCRF
jgi:hypothetical protein